MERDDLVKSANETYKNLCEILDGIKWVYKKDDNNRSVFFTVTGDDIPMNFLVIVDEKRQLIRITSGLSFDIPQNKIVDAAVVVSYINYKLVDGCFDLNILDGKIYFNMTSSYKCSLIGKELFLYMIRVAGKTVDDFNDKLLLFAKDRISVPDLIKEIDG